MKRQQSFSLIHDDELLANTDYYLTTIPDYSQGPEIRKGVTQHEQYFKLALNRLTSH